MNAPRDVLLMGVRGASHEHIVTRCQRDGCRLQLAMNGDDAASVQKPSLALDAIVVQTMMHAARTPFLELSDALMHEALRQFIDTSMHLQRVMMQLRVGGAIVVITSRNYLGAQGGAQEAAMAAATIALMRCLALESMPRQVRVNVIAIDTPSERAEALDAAATHAAGIADIVAFLLSDAARLLNGEVLLANGGRNLQMREARQRL